jgi:NTP pyrophosphatase (non-canonical NTP hydrolase)
MTDSIAQLTHMIREFCEERDWDQFHTPKDLAIGAITEAAELLEHFRFQSDEQSIMLFADPSSKAAIEEEVADIFFFLLRFSQRFDIDPGAALIRKMAISARKYPVNLSKGRNLKYTDLRPDGGPEEK